MKINVDKEWPAIRDRQPQMKPLEQGAGTFKSFVRNQTETAEIAALFEGLLATIDEQGKRLSRFKTIKDLQAYKRLVQQFVEKAVSHGLGLSQSHNWQYARGQVQTIIRTIDQHVMELTEEVLKNGADSLLILETIGEIKGLLINLYL
ncbi:hypothetical protein GCM10011391_35940 [Pullulanibacillus camelliae]|uniref:DUF327 family protein n=1 Tax=Pullulanibacillus camelliae TaxID=1707096 RepID=A0A8J3E1F3_9BACL|nr:YaaR family protein [Pullulanibacillus camelliae]GGE53858.1 hypothetical protein GCM10011391_35940 [Pullulanibacillus camelliae]